MSHGATHGSHILEPLGLHKPYLIVLDVHASTEVEVAYAYVLSRTTMSQRFQSFQAGPISEYI